ncbi:MAG TPA: HEAT repeat domain-containing protein, partial [Pyrinomonadaceae bacterium]
MPNIFSLVRRSRPSFSRIGFAFVFLLALAGCVLVWSRAQAAGGSEQELKKLSRFVQTSNSPSVKIFREGRDLIEAEEWAEAEQKFGSFITQYPKDRDVDAALYWLAYSMKKQEKFREAGQQLERLMKEFPKSSWRDEAEAMLTEIAPQLGDRRTIEAGLNKDNDEIKIVALQSLFESNPERAMGYVTEILKPGSKASRNLKEAAISLLASHGGPQAVSLLLEIARTEPDPELRQTAIHHLGDEGGEAVIDELMKLYAAERDLETKEQILHALSEMESPRAWARLLEVAQSGDQLQLRLTAIHQLGERENGEAISDLLKIYDSDHNAEIRSEILHVLSDSTDPRAEARLLEIARAGDDVEAREQAIRWLGEKDTEAAIAELIKIYDAERNAEVREEILQAFSEMHNPRARAKLVEVARGSADAEMRQRAIHQLGETDDPQTIELLINLYDQERS